MKNKFLKVAIIALTTSTLGTLKAESNLEPDFKYLEDLETSLDVTCTGLATVFAGMGVKLYSLTIEVDSIRLALSNIASYDPIKQNELQVLQNKAAQRAKILSHCGTLGQVAGTGLILAGLGTFAISEYRHRTETKDQK